MTFIDATAAKASARSAAFLTIAFQLACITAAASTSVSANADNQQSNRIREAAVGESVTTNSVS
jgi:hypothetical protein